MARILSSSEDLPLVSSSALERISGETITFGLANELNQRPISSQFAKEVS